MDILEVKFPVQEILKIMKMLQFKDSNIKLVGTGALKSQLFPADYDFLSKVDQKYKNNITAYNEFKNILNDFDNTNNFYFVEFKFQSLDGSKFKIYDIDDFTKNTFNKNFNNIDYCKIDGITTIRGEIKEVSCVYFFQNVSITQDQYRQILLDDQKHYYDDSKYYKSLKRIMLASKNENVPDKNFIVLISKFFNSNVGRLYELKNMIDACVIYLNKYKDKQSKQIVKNFLIDHKLKGIKLENLEKLSDVYGSLIDREGLTFYKYYKIPVGKLPKYNTIK